MFIEQYPLSSAQPLTEAYIHRTDERVESLFGYHSEQEQDWIRRMKRLEHTAASRADAVALAETLRAYNTRFGASPEMIASIGAIAEGAPVIVGGQQAGLWSGPIMVVHKAVSIIGAAKWASELLGRTVVPVFWIAGEDHDWDEANHTYVMSGNHELRKLGVQRPEGARTSVSRTTIDEETWRSLLAELDQALPHAEFKPAMMEQLTAAAERASTLSELFAAILTLLFGKEGLVLLDADEPSVRKLESPMFRRLIEHNDDLEQAYISTAERVKSFGYEPQADVVPASANLFVFQAAKGNERTLLHKLEGKFRDRKGTSVWTMDELLHLADHEPWQLSNNVLTRPLMQDYLLPVLGTVLGPGEIAYWSLTGEAFRRLDMEMPIVVPRMSFTLVEGTIAKHMAKYDLTFEDVRLRFEERKQRWLMEQDKHAIDERFAAVKQSFNDLYGPILALAASVQAGLAPLGETNHRKIVEQIEYLETKTKDAHNKQYEASTRQLDRIASSLWPAGKPQERVLNMTAYWNRYGFTWLERLLEAPFDRTGGHRIVYL
ncbi:bacillithiol biosynthesis cysteine-adding enzyme BshC [Paenibacillus sp. NEAU-GSW1]|uniref:bacillithiol biosynthesis cysteine-adding enzyme BshC n=1 Tax=Paenibacillus sp. NEAU-GSW1 TaxID=2682486 RepID=UPI0012E1783E|nr:bacillithiol biosynthesis cysteine-adding enzyme BshC [Paenibacillus sp. NEAU-GSW1]MUT66205.1 bacillithiol biosynthesis cysteine-adding enzyme BshC [Paenibacillus sp. NEAU-GSW1]